MSILPILIHPDPRLKKLCEPVDTFDAALRTFTDDMVETMYDAPGIGLAAPQVGVMKRVLVMDCAEREGEAPAPMALINPEIIASSEEMNEHEEGCLSIPDQFGKVTRPAVVTVSYFDIDGAPQSQEFDGLWATCVQHEIDHLNGKLFIDYLGSVRRQMITQKMKKLKRERARS
ncbi:MAG: peptide deformylase [Pikeienuella sp.]